VGYEWLDRKVPLGWGDGHNEYSAAQHAWCCGLPGACKASRAVFTSSRCTWRVWSELLSLLGCLAVARHELLSLPSCFVFLETCEQDL
jgi:hypothetical protein